MCWFEFAEKPPVALMRADGDVTCYKVVKHDLRSLLFNYQYHLNKKQKAVKLRLKASAVATDPGMKYYMVEKGYHSYADLRLVEERMGDIPIDKKIIQYYGASFPKARNIMLIMAGI